MPSGYYGDWSKLGKGIEVVSVTELIATPKVTDPVHPVWHIDQSVKYKPTGESCTICRVLHFSRLVLEMRDRTYRIVHMSDVTT